MTHYDFNICFYFLQPQKIQSLLNPLFIFFLLLLPHANSISFNFHSFQPNLNNTITFQGDAFSSNGVLQLTKNQLEGPINSSAGRASYAEPMHLWDASTGRLTDFHAEFSFIVKAVGTSTLHGDGFSFFIAPFESNIPNNSSGGYLGLFNSEVALTPSRNQIVAVEFDNFLNPWDPVYNHIGINVNSIQSVSVAKLTCSFQMGSIVHAWISYYSTTQRLDVFAAYVDIRGIGMNSSLSITIDLRNVLPEWVRVGFSAATGQLVELHQITSWSFTSTLED